MRQYEKNANIYANSGLEKYNPEKRWQDGNKVLTLVTHNQGRAVCDLLYVI